MWRVALWEEVPQLGQEVRLLREELVARQPEEREEAVQRLEEDR